MRKSFEELTAPSKSYRNKSIRAAIAVIIFCLIYLLLPFYFLASTYWLLTSLRIGHPYTISLVLMAVINFVVAGILLHKIYRIKRQKNNKKHEFTLRKEDYPQFFEFINSVARDVGAAEPKRIIIDTRVNAALRVKTSIWRLFSPQKKDLIIGLGLFNVLTVSELKAVLAHEFGHFIQRHLWMTRWSYVANMVLHRLVINRDGTDKTLGTLSRAGLKIGLIGWIFGFHVWAIRGIVEAMYWVVLKTQRGLSREAEFHADLVAVATTGSDPIVQSLYKVEAAEHSYGLALQTVNEQISKGYRPVDLFTIQEAELTEYRDRMNDVNFGVIPDLKSTDKHMIRLFKEDFVFPVDMWSTHPSPVDRENNAKKKYIHRDQDKNNAWSVIDHSDRLRQEVTSWFFDPLNKEEISVSSQSDSLAFVKQSWEKERYRREYLGLYIDAEITRTFKNIEFAYGIITERNLKHQNIEDLYKAEISETLRMQRVRAADVQQLQNFQSRRSGYGSSSLTYKGREIKRSDLPKLLENAKSRLHLLNKKIEDQHRLIRTSHVAMARELGATYKVYLEKSLQLVHYAEHTYADVLDNIERFRSVYDIVTANGRIDFTDARHLIEDGIPLCDTLKKVFDDASTIKLPQEILEKLEVESWQEYFGVWEFANPDRNNLNSWLENIDSWNNHVLILTRQLQFEALDHLLSRERMIFEAFVGQRTLNESLFDVSTITLPEEYPTMNPGDERPRRTKMILQERIELGIGVFPKILKGASALLIFGVTLFLLMSNPKFDYDIYLVNGLSNEVMVELNDTSFYLEANSSFKYEFQADDGDTLDIKSFTAQGVVLDDFAQRLTRGPNFYYNIAGAAFIGKLYVEYGDVKPRRPWYYGTEIWKRADGYYNFQEAPDQIAIDSRSSGTLRSVLLPIEYEVTLSLKDKFKDNEEFERYIRLHFQHDTMSPQLIDVFLPEAQKLEDFDALIAKRNSAFPAHVEVLDSILQAIDNSSAIDSVSIPELP